MTLVPEISRGLNTMKAKVSIRKAAMRYPDGDDSLSCLHRVGNSNAQATVLHLTIEKEPGAVRLVRCPGKVFAQQHGSNGNFRLSKVSNRIQQRLTL